jgi:hypothetical protein
MNSVVSCLRSSTTLTIINKKSTYARERFISVIVLLKVSRFQTGKQKLTFYQYIMRTGTWSARGRKSTINYIMK